MTACWASRSVAAAGLMPHHLAEVMTGNATRLFNPRRSHLKTISYISRLRFNTSQIFSDSWSRRNHLRNFAGTFNEQLHGWVYGPIR
jgi:hypothetical protein